LYAFYRGHKIISKEARELKKTIKMIVDSSEHGLLGFDKLRVEIRIYENWMYKNGSVSKKDIDNRTKFLIDAVFEALGIDDRYIFIQLLVKEQSDTEEKAVIEITEL